VGRTRRLAWWCDTLRPASSGQSAGSLGDAVWEEEVATDSGNLKRHDYEAVHRVRSLVTAFLHGCMRLGYSLDGQDFADTEHSWAQHCKGD
jgi:hypothetical protein